MRATAFANGIGKSGNNLLIKLCKSIGLAHAPSGFSENLLLGRHRIARWLIRGARFERSPVPVGLPVGANVSERWVRAFLRRHAGKCIGGHAPFSGHLLQIFTDSGVRPIQIVRDPRDVTVSFAHWVIKNIGFYAYPAYSSLSFEERMHAFILGVRRGDLHMESLATMMDRSYGWITRPDDVLVVRFEDLVGPQGGGQADTQIETVRRVAAWLHVEIADPEEIAAQLFGGTHTFHSGLIGQWQNAFTPKTYELFAQSIGDRLIHWGYK